LCVPAFLQRELAGKLGGEDAGTRLLAWYPTVVAKFDGQAVGDDSIRFWRNEFAAWVGTVTRAHGSSGSRTGDSMDAAKRSLRRRLERLAQEPDDVKLAID
jgi:hypothetical protein